MVRAGGANWTMKRLWAFAIGGAPDQNVIVEVDEPVAEGGEELATRAG
jgi:hypothetical protein